MPEIKITCEGSDAVPLETLQYFQGNLKTLTKPQYEKIRKSIEKYGFAFPVFVWKDGETNHIIDGHQRVFTVREMLNDGFTLAADVPVAWIHAKNKTEAKKKVLLSASRYGRIDEVGAADFLEDVELDDLLDMVDIPELTMELAGIDKRGGEDYEGLIDEFGTKRTGEGNEMYFYVEFYQHKEKFEQAKALLEPLLKTKHEIDRDKFLELLGGLKCGKEDAE